MRYDLRDTRSRPQETLVASGSVGAIRREPIALDPSMSVMEAFAAVTRGCITHIATAAEVARCCDNPEGVHQLRVGIRRLRAAFSVFGPALPRRRPAVLKQLRSLQRRLGAARELDVLLEETIASMPEKLRKRRGMRALAKAVENSRVACRRRARAALASKRCMRSLSQLGPAIDRYLGQGGGSAASPQMRQPISGFAVDVLHSRHRKVRKLGDRIGDLGPGELHELRIRIKKLRYPAEFFRDLAPRAQSERYLRELKDLQRVLGMAHDAVVASTVIVEIANCDAAEAGRATKVVRDWTDACLKREKRKLRGAWRRFAKHKPPLKSGGDQSSVGRWARWFVGSAFGATCRKLDSDRVPVEHGMSVRSCDAYRSRGSHQDPRPGQPSALRSGCQEAGIEYGTEAPSGGGSRLSGRVGAARD